MKREILTWMETAVDGEPEEIAWYGMAKIFRDMPSVDEVHYCRGTSAEALGLAVNNGHYKHIYVTSFGNCNEDTELTADNAVFYISARENTGIWSYEIQCNEIVKGKHNVGKSLVIMVDKPKYWLKKGWPDGPKEV